MTNILAVDDEESVRHLLSRMLSRGGYEYALAADAAEVRKFIKDRNFELILCDVAMPGESGIDLSKRLVCINFKWRDGSKCSFC
ncbi:MAG: response regulator [Desulfobacterales bacterium]|nr:response regulator [Desulfobacterales bacterium]